MSNVPCLHVRGNWSGQNDVVSALFSIPFLFLGSDEDEVVKSKKVFRSQTVASQNPETELMLEGDEDTASLLQEKEMDNVGGKSTHKHLH